MSDVELRLRSRAEARARFLGVIVGLAVIFGAWLIPGYWHLRGRLYPGLPLFADQWIFMALIALGVSKVTLRWFGRLRFPYLDEQHRIID